MKKRVYIAVVTLALASLFAGCGKKSADAAVSVKDDVVEFVNEELPARQIMTMRLAFTMHILQEAVIRILMHLRHLCRIPQFQQWRIVSQRFLISRLQQMR